MIARRYIDDARALLGRNDPEAAKVYALLAVAEATLETRQGGIRLPTSVTPRDGLALDPEQPEFEVVSCRRHGYHRCGYCMILRELSQNTPQDASSRAQQVD